MIDLARLRRLCEAATPGPWRAEHHTVVDGHEDESGDWSIISETKLYTPDAVDRAGGQTEPTPLQVAHIYVKHIASEGWPGLVADAEFIAALNPAVVVALLDRIEGAERIIEIAKEFRDKGTKLTSCDRGPCQQVVECDDRSDPQARLYDALAAMEKRGGAAEKMGTKE